MAGTKLLLVMCDFNGEFESQLNDWYNNEQIPKMLSVPGVLAAYRWRALEGELKYVAAYDLADGSVLESPEFLAAAKDAPETASPDPGLASHFPNLKRAVYDHVRTLPSPEPTDLSGARALLLRGLGIAPQNLEEFEDWYYLDHLPNLAAVPGIMRARRFKIIGPEMTQGGRIAPFVALYDMVGPEALTTPDWQVRAGTPWSTRMRRIWISYERIVGERLYP